MPYDGSGNFTIINNFEEDRVNNVSIDSGKMDANFNDVANGLSNVMLRDGASAMAGALNMASHKILNVTAGTASTDAVNKGQMNTALSAKQNTITGGASTIASSNLTASRALISNGSGKVAVSAATSTEVGYLSGVTSAIQTQINACVKTSGNQTIAGTKTFSSTIAGSINGNAATVTNGVYTTGNQTIGGTKTFSSATYGTASSAANSFVTTVGSTKAANGYFKLGNGMIVNFYSTTSDQTSGTVFTFKEPFSSATSYGIALCGTNAEIYYPDSGKTATSIKINANASGKRTFIAIGY